MFVLLGVVLSLFGGAAALASEAYARSAATPACHCPHGETNDDRASCACCSSDMSKGGCLPTSSAAGATALAPAIELPNLVPVPPLTGILAVAEVARLHDRLMVLRLERPPRA